MRAPPWYISEWLNTSQPLHLSEMRGSVVVACAFQMLCSGCVSQAIPQMKRMHDQFGPKGVVAVGLHTVMEHHDAMTVAALRGFVAEHDIRFPVGVDSPAQDGGRIPRTMQAYHMEGTPTLLLIDRSGSLRRQALGHIPYDRLAVEIDQLVNER